MKKSAVIHPCNGCVYFPVYRESTRTASCNGRKTKTERKKRIKNFIRKEKRGCAIYGAALW